MANVVANSRRLIPIREVFQEGYVDEDNTKACVHIDNHDLNAVLGETERRELWWHSGVYRKHERSHGSDGSEYDPSRTYWFTQTVTKKDLRARTKYTASLEFTITWKDDRWEHYVENLVIEEDPLRPPDDWGIIERKLYAYNQNGDSSDPIPGIWIHAQDGLPAGTYATAWARSGFWKALVAECRAAGGEVVYQDAERPGTRCHVLFLIDSSKSMATKDFLLEGRTMRRIDGAALMLKEYAENDPGQDCDTYTALLVSDVGTQVICKQSTARKLLDCLETCPMEPKHGASYKRIVECIQAMASIRERTRVIFLSDARAGDASPYLTFYCQYLSWLNANCKVLPMDTLQVYTIGLQEAGFELLQQMATLGNGMYLPCSSSITSLRTAFATVSRTITQRREAAELAEKARAEGRLPAVRSKREERSSVYELPGLYSFGRKICKALHGKSTHFSYDGHSFQERVESVSVEIHNLPFERGAMRQVHLMRSLSEPDSLQVCKVGRWLEEPYLRAEAERDAKSMAIASYLAKEFCRLCGLSPEGFRFVDAKVYECASQDSWGRAKSHVFVGEPHLKTRFIKFTGNDGFVNQLDQSLEAQAFQHFSFQACSEKLMVTDIQGSRQGGGLLLTDPQILSLWGGFGAGDLRKKGMRACMSSHECNYLCSRWTLGLKSIAKDAEGMPSIRKLVDVAQLSKDCAAAQDSLGAAVSSGGYAPSERKVVKTARSSRRRSPARAQTRKVGFAALATESDASD